jgi:hypothetical protein
MAHASKVLLAATALVLVSSACSSGGSSAKANPTADLAAAKSAVLTKADLPDYDTSPHQASNDLPDSAKTAFRQCTGTQVTPLDSSGNQQRADSDEFAKDNTTIDNTVIIAPKKSDIDSRWKAVTVSNAPTCLEDLFRSAATPDTSDPSAKLDAIHVDKLPLGNVGDRDVGYRAKASVSTSQGSADEYIDVIFAQKGRGVAQLFVAQPSTPFDTATEAALLKKVTDRMPKS